MNGPHDLGGKDGFGPVVPDTDTAPFHAEWERRMFGIALTVPFSVPFGDDHLRREIERIPPADYLKASYYELWFRSISKLLHERGAIDLETLDAYTGGPRQPLVADAVRSEDTFAAYSEGVSTRADVAEVAKNRDVGDIVMVKNNHPDHHTRVPQYVRGRRGRIILDHGIFSFPDTNSEDQGECPQHCYTVEFDARELWGEQAEKGAVVTVDLWESYLEHPSGSLGPEQASC